MIKLSIQLRVKVNDLIEDKIGLDLIQAMNELDSTDDIKQLCSTSITAYCMDMGFYSGNPYYPFACDMTDEAYIKQFHNPRLGNWNKKTIYGQRRIDAVIYLIDQLKELDL